MANKDVERSEPKADDVAQLEKLKAPQDRALITGIQQEEERNLGQDVGSPTWFGIVRASHNNEERSYPCD